jgi:hypothetical protein
MKVEDYKTTIKAENSIKRNARTAISGKRPKTRSYTKQFINRHFDPFNKAFKTTHSIVKANSVSSQKQCRIKQKTEPFFNFQNTNMITLNTIKKIKRTRTAPRNAKRKTASFVSIARP